MPRGHYPRKQACPRERFLRHVEMVPGGCWLWTGGTKGNTPDRRYGMFWLASGTVIAARWSYEQFVGPIPEGWTVDHVKARGCTSTLCVKPTHLEAVPLRVNLMRGDTLAACNAAKTHCPRRHPYDYVRPDGARGCKRCDHDRKYGQETVGKTTKT